MWKDLPQKARYSCHNDICKNGESGCGQRRSKGLFSEISERKGQGKGCGETFQRMKEVWGAIMDNKSEHQPGSEIPLFIYGLSVKITP